MKIDINCDMGEGFGMYTIGDDERILPFVSSVNIACGYHAGDPTVMRNTVRKAMRHGAAIGAHPGFPDLAGFGRREMNMSEEDIYSMIMYQIGALDAFVRAEGGRMHHVKPHGALYNMAAKNMRIARAIATAVHNVNDDLILYGLSGSLLIEAGREVGLKTANEAFADRTYQIDGTLTARSRLDAVHTDEQQVVRQVLSLVMDKKVQTADGTWISMQADTICLHGDGAHAVPFASAIHKALHEKGIIIQPALG